VAIGTAAVTALLAVGRGRVAVAGSGRLIMAGSQVPVARGGVAGALAGLRPREIPAPGASIRTPVVRDVSFPRAVMATEAAGRETIAGAHPPVRRSCSRRRRLHGVVRRTRSARSRGIASRVRPRGFVARSRPVNKLRLRPDLVSSLARFTRPGVVLIAAVVLALRGHRPGATGPAGFAPRGNRRLLRPGSRGATAAEFPLIGPGANAAAVVTSSRSACGTVRAGQADRTGIAVSRRQSIGPDRTELLEPVLCGDVRAIVRQPALVALASHSYLPPSNRGDARTTMSGPSAARSSSGLTGQQSHAGEVSATRLPLPRGIPTRPLAWHFVTI
jgi:hypothetical protein